MMPSPSMRYRRFGRTELQMPVFSCGGMRFQQSWTATAKVTENNQRNLEATMDRALELGLYHFETARGYGTSEVQVGTALGRLPRDRVILQTKVAPKPNPAEFESFVAESFRRLGVDRIDLFAFHGLNDRKHLDMVVNGGCYETIDRLRQAGRIGHVGFSTHAPAPLIVDAIETDLFDYVNLHYYFILQENLPAVRAAARHDMGVFIISPNDKGGHLHTPRPRFAQACQPSTPMQFNDLFCLSDPAIHTLSLGAARPTDFDEHLAVLPQLEQAAALAAPAVERLNYLFSRALGLQFAGDYLAGIPEWDRLPGGVNVRKILWLHTLCEAWDLVPYARSRYNMLSQDDHWFPGNKAVNFDEPALRAALDAAGLGSRLDGILATLRAAHTRLDGAGS